MAENVPDILQRFLHLVEVPPKQRRIFEGPTGISYEWYCTARETTVMADGGVLYFRIVHNNGKQDAWNSNDVSINTSALAFDLFWQSGGFCEY